MSKVRINDLAKELEVSLARFSTSLRSWAYPRAKPTPARWKRMKRIRFARISSADRGPRHTPAHRRARRADDCPQDRPVPHLQARRCDEGHSGQEKRRRGRGALRPRCRQGARSAQPARRQLLCTRPGPGSRRARCTGACCCCRPRPRLQRRAHRSAAAPAPPIVAPPPAAPAIASRPPAGAVVAKPPAGAPADRSSSPALKPPAGAPADRSSSAGLKPPAGAAASARPVVVVAPPPQTAVPVKPPAHKEEVVHTAEAVVAKPVAAPAPMAAAAPVPTAEAPAAAVAVPAAPTAVTAAPVAAAAAPVIAAEVPAPVVPAPPIRRMVMPQTGPRPVYKATIAPQPPPPPPGAAGTATRQANLRSPAFRRLPDSVL